MFKNKAFYWFLIIGLSVLILMNLSTFIYTGNYLALLPIIIQSGLLVSIFLKHRQTKLFLKIWLIVFLIISPSLQIIGRLLQSAGDNVLDTTGMPAMVINLLIGIIVFLLVQENMETPPKDNLNEKSDMG